MASMCRFRLFLEAMIDGPLRHSLLIGAGLAADRGYLKIAITSGAARGAPPWIGSKGAWILITCWRGACAVGLCRGRRTGWVVTMIGPSERLCGVVKR